MGAQKRYNSEMYEKKLETVMNRFEVDKYDYDYTRREAWVEFWYKGQHYRFEHSVDKAAAHGQPLSYGSDAFCQIVLSLEDLARASNRGIYDLQTWVEGMKALPWAPPIPECFRVLGFEAMPNLNPDTKDIVNKKYRDIIKTAHPDAGGTGEKFNKLTTARDECLKYLESSM